MKSLFDKISFECSKNITRTYSTSFAAGIRFLDKSLHQHIYAIYGFVRLADEIVDSFHDYNKSHLIAKFRQETVEAIESKISLNPVLNSFQYTVSQFKIEWDLIDSFLKSMEMDLSKIEYSQQNYNNYIYGSAEVVGLMCLKVFSQGNQNLYNKLKPYAIKLGSAFQKVNFLRDLKADFQDLGRIYFPNINFETFTNEQKIEIENEIGIEFDEALIGIKMLPKSSRIGVLLAFMYYKKLFNRIKSLPIHTIRTERIRISNFNKIALTFEILLKQKLNPSYI